MDLRAQARSGKPFHLLLGAQRFEEMVASIEGYWRCSWRNGLVEGGYGDFRTWLRDVRGELPDGWTTSYLEICNGDHEKAMMRLLDFVAEYLKLHPRPPVASSSESPSQPEPERCVSVLDDWMAFLPDIQRGRPLWFFFGNETLPTLAAYVRGYLRCCERNGLVDTRWLAFSRWLAESKGLPPESWESRLLEDCGGAHPAAMRRLLDLAAEFAQSPPPGVRGRSRE
jgi:hypothetical protein